MGNYDTRAEVHLPPFLHGKPDGRPHAFGLLSGLCFASIIFSRTWTHLHESQVIDVTGTARMGIVQTNPLYPSATSWEGNNDHPSLEKTITTTVGATFAFG